MTGRQQRDHHHPVDAKGKTGSTVYRSPVDFFPADLPRPVAPDLLLRTVTLALALAVVALGLLGAAGFAARRRG